MIILRAIMIALGAAVISEFAWVLYVFAVFLIATGVKMLFAGDKPTDIGKNPVLRFMKHWLRVTETHYEERFLVRVQDSSTGKRLMHVTPLFMALVLIEIADVVFAVDSVPAIFAITTNPFIVYTSNIFAILGLHALYFALSAMIERFHYLKYALAIVLIIIGGKIFAADLLDIEKIPPAPSLAMIVSIIGAGVVVSLIWSRPEAKKAAHQGKIKGGSVNRAYRLPLQPHQPPRPSAHVDARDSFLSHTSDHHQARGRQHCEAMQGPPLSPCQLGDLPQSAR